MRKTVDPTNDTTGSRTWRVTCDSLAAAIVSMMLVTVLPSRHRSEVPENLLFGLLGGTFVGLVIWLSVRYTAWLFGKVRPDRPLQIRLAWAVFCVTAHAGLFILLVSIGVRKPFLGLMAIVIWGFPLPVFILTGNRLEGVSDRLARFATVALFGGLAILVVLGPIDPRPEIMQFSDPSETDLVLMSWNLGLGQPLSAASQLEHLAAVAAAIEESGAHVVCIQETASQTYLDRLLVKLGKPWEGIVSVDRYMVTGIISRIGGEFLTPSPGAFYGGPALLRLQTTNGPIEILSIHLPPEYAALFRKRYMDSLLNDAEHATGPRVIAGDFNIDPAGWWDRVSSVFTDTIAVDRDLLASLHPYAADVGRRGPATAALSRRVDYVFVPHTIACTEYRVLFGCKRGRMDHRPIVARLAVGELERRIREYSSGRGEQ